MPRPKSCHSKERIQCAIGDIKLNCDYLEEALYHFGEQLCYDAGKRINETIEDLKKIAESLKSCA